MAIGLRGQRMGNSARSIVTAVIALSLGTADARGQERQISSPHYLFVATNDGDADKLGPWPLDRRVHAAAIDRARQDGAKAVILKFFFDRPSLPEADAKLAEAIALMPVYLQFAFDGGGKKGEDPPVWRHDLAPATLTALFHSSPSLLPLALFEKNAAGLGFVSALPDPDYNRIEILGTSGSGIAASLQLLSLEASLGTQVSARDMRLTLKSKRYPIETDGRVVCPYLEGGRPQEHSLFAFLKAQVPKNQVRDRVVIIGNTRRDTPRFPIPNNTSLPVHEVFFRQILCLDRLT